MVSLFDVDSSRKTELEHTYDFLGISNPLIQEATEGALFALRRHENLSLEDRAWGMGIRLPTRRTSGDMPHQNVVVSWSSRSCCYEEQQQEPSLRQKQ